MMLRVFIALEIPAGIQDAIAHNTAALRDALPRTLVRWVAPKNVHLTLKFLGDISTANLEQLAGTLKGETALHGMFSISVGGLGAFPSPGRARVIWIGLEAPKALEALRRGVEAAAAQLGYNQEERPFSPHLTIGRVVQNISTSELQRIRSGLETSKVGALGTVRVEAVHIFKSDLLPGGAVYTRLYALPLKTT
jgi:RNA 2',3'-cyclic 3'-phosphodiesterase